MYESWILTLQSIGVWSLEKWLICSFIWRTCIFSKLGLRISFRSCQEGLLSSLNVFIFSTPRLNSTILKSSSEWETQKPRSSDIVDLVHVIKVHWSLFFSLSTWQKLNNYLFTVIPTNAGGTVLESARTVLWAYSTKLFSFFLGCSDPYVTMFGLRRQPSNKTLFFCRAEKHTDRTFSVIRWHYSAEWGPSDNISG